MTVSHALQQHYYQATTTTATTPTAAAVRRSRGRARKKDTTEALSKCDVICCSINYHVSDNGGTGECVGGGWVVVVIMMFVSNNSPGEIRWATLACLVRGNLICKRPTPLPFQKPLLHWILSQWKQFCFRQLFFQPENKRLPNMKTNILSTV